MAAVVCQRLEHRLLLARPHAANLPDAAVVQCGLEIVQRVDPQLRVQLAHGPRADALQPHQIEQGGGELREELAVVFRSAGLSNLAHLLREVAPDPGNLQQRGVIEIGQSLGGARHALGGVAVRRGS